MSKFIKNNIEARFSSLVDGEHGTSLFQTNKLIGRGIYLMPHQEHFDKSNPSETIMIMVFRGTGELKLTEQDEKPLHLQIMKGDILVIPANANFKILNTDQACLVFTQITIR